MVRLRQLSVASAKTAPKGRQSKHLSLVTWLLPRPQSAANAGFADDLALGAVVGFYGCLVAAFLFFVVAWAWS